MTNDSLQPLLHRARRRLILAALVRQVGHRVLLLMAVAVVAMLIQRICGQQGGAIRVMTLAAVALLAHALATFRLPTLTQTALELDRQFSLHELLTTAYTCPGSDDPFARAARSQAHAIARTLDLRRLNVGPLAYPSWILSLILLGVLPLLYAPLPPATAFAPIATLSTIDPARDLSTNRFRPALPAMPSYHHDAAPAGVSDDASSLSFEQSMSNAVALARSLDDRSESAAASAGAGLAQSPSSPPAAPARPTPATPRDVAPTESAATASAGNAPAAVHTAGGDASASGSITTRPTLAGSPARHPGDSSASPDALSPANLADIPAPYRDVVKAYFAR